MQKLGHMAQITFLPWSECQMPHGMKKEWEGKLKENGSFKRKCRLYSAA